MHVLHKISIRCLWSYQMLLQFLLMSLCHDTKMVEKSLNRHDLLTWLFIQALKMYLQMPFVPRCVHKNLRAMEFYYTRHDSLRRFFNHYPSLDFTLYTLKIWHTSMGMGHNLWTTIHIQHFLFIFSNTVRIGTGALCCSWLILRIW